MNYELEEIIRIRKHLGITQSELAKRAGVSQSLIAKIESKRIDPAYTNAKKIFEALQSMGKKHEISAGEIMNAKIISINPKDTIRGAIDKMKKSQISQLPVIDGNNIVGLVSESTLIDALANKNSGSVEEIMEDAPPVVSKNASVNAVSSLLKHYPVVLISGNGKLLGLITKADLLAKVYAK